MYLYAVTLSVFTHHVVRYLQYYEIYNFFLTFSFELFNSMGIITRLGILNQSWKLFIHDRNRFSSTDCRVFSRSSRRIILNYILSGLLKLKIPILV